MTNITATQGDVTIQTTTSTDAQSQTNGGAGSTGISVAAMLANATVGRQTTSALSGQASIAGNDILIANNSTTNQANAEIVVGGVAIASGTGGNATATVGGSINAYSAANSSLNATGNITISSSAANTDAVATATAGNLGLGVAVSALVATSNVTGTVSSWLAGSATLTTGTLEVSSTGSGSSSATANPVGVSLIGGGTGSSATAQYSGSLQAYLDSTSQVDSQGAVAVSATTTASSTAEAYGGTVSGGVGISVLLANASLIGSTLAYVAAGSEVTAASLSVAANGTLDATANMFTVTGSLLVAGTGGQANATVSGHVLSYVGAAAGASGTPASTAIDTSGAATITASSNMQAQATADGGGGGAISAGGMTASAILTGNTLAYLGSGTSLEASSLTVQATANQAQAAASTTIGAVSALGGVGSNATATVGGTVGAYGANGVTVTATGNAAFLATMTQATANATANGGSGSLVSVAAMLANATTNPTTTAYLGSGASLQAGSLNVAASSINSATANTLVVGVAGITGSGGNATANASPQTIAYVAQNSLITLGTGAASITATATSTATADSRGGSGGAVGAVSVMLATATANGSTQAYVDQGAQVTAGSLTVAASSTPTANAQSFLTAISAFTGSGVTNSALLSDTVVARLGAASGTTPATATQFQIGSGGAQVTSTWNGDASTSITVGSGGLLANAGGTTATNTIEPTIQGYVGPNTQLNSTGNVSILTPVQANSTANSFGIAAAGGLAAYGTTTTSTLQPNLQAYVDTNASLTVASLTVQSSLNTDSQGNPITTNVSQAIGTAGSGSLVAGGTGANVTATQLPTVMAWLGTGATVNAFNNVTFAALAYQESDAQANSTNVALGAAIGVTLSNATAQGTIASVIYGGILGAQAVNVAAYSNVDLNSQGQANSGGILAAGNGTNVQATIGTGNNSSPMVNASVAGTGQIAATGNVTVDSLLNSTVYAESSGVTVSAGGSVGAVPATVTVQPGIVAQIESEGLITTLNGSVAVLAGHNVDPITRSFLSNPATVTTRNLSAALGVSVGATTISSTTNPYVEALLDTDARISAPQGNVKLGAFSAATPQALLSNGGGALISFSSGTANATAQGMTLATVNGTVQGSTPGFNGAINVTIESRNNDDVLAQIKQSSGGGVALSNTNANSALSSNVSTTVGGAIYASGNVTIDATSNSESDSFIKNISGGAISITNYDATSNIAPNLTTSIGSGATIQAGGTLNVTLNQGQALPQYSDGTFNPSSTANQLNLTNNSITFSEPHGLQTGNGVTYQTLNNLPAVGGLVDGRSYGVIVLTDTSLQLGDSFVAQAQASPSSMGVDLDDNTITFSGPHQLVGNGQPGNSDQVLYMVPSGSTPIGGLTPNQPYLVNVVNPTTIRLIDPSALPAAPKSFAGTAVQADDQTI